MRRTILSAACVVLMLGAAEALAAERTRVVMPFDSAWRFTRGDASGAEMPAFDDATWAQVTVPHDWSIAGPFDKDNKTGGAGAFLPAGVGWYRKHFTVGKENQGRRVFVEFDGVMANSDVWVNGAHLGHRPYGYVSFSYDLTDNVKWDGDNVLVVRADDDKQPASRWYAGAGIYRHVRLLVCDAVHTGYHETFVSTPDIQADSATVRVRTVVLNQSDTARDVKVLATVNGPPGSAPDGAYSAFKQSDSVKIEPGKSAELSADVELPWKPALWDIDHPQMHTARVAVLTEGDEVADEERIPFGIRDAKFDADTGFWLNGRNFKLKGVCLHGDAGALGVAVPRSAWARRLATLKSLGVNAIRTAHNPPDPAFLDLCDRMGFLVMDEMFDCWTVAKNPYDYHLYFDKWSHTDTADTVKRDRNHPSVILYSAGNEIHDTPKQELAKSILKGLIDVFHENDPTRPVTQALFRPNVSHDYDDGLADMLDVVGQNYRENEIIAAHEQKPTRKIVGTENGKGLKEWAAVRDHPFHSGHFIWTGIDYLGESRRWPRVGYPGGLLDLTGDVYAIGYQRQSWWGDKPMVYAARDEGGARTGNQAGEPQARPLRAGDWTPKDLAPHDERVEVYSNCDDVELLLNGKSLGTQGRGKDRDAPRVFKLTFAPGTLEAVGKNGGNEVARHTLKTAGNAAKLALTAERTKLPASWDEVCYLTARITDKDGVQQPWADEEVTFSVTGPAQIAAVGNGDFDSHEPFQATHRKTFAGRCVAIVRATGPGAITVTATADGLESSSATINGNAPK